MTFITRVKTMMVLPKGEPIFSERCTQIEIVDEAGGEYLEVSQRGAPHVPNATICINPEEWPVLRETIDRMMAEVVL